MTVSTFRDFPLADRSRPWTGSALPKRIVTYRGLRSVMWVCE